MDFCGVEGIILPDIQAGATYQAEVRLWRNPLVNPTLTAAFRGPQVINIIASPVGDSFVFRVEATDTAPYLPGSYWWEVTATSGTDVSIVGKGQNQVIASLAAETAGYDGRTPAQIALDSINALIENRATSDQMRYRINNRELWRQGIPDLLKLRALYMGIVRREKAKLSGRNRFGRPIYVTFNER